MRDGNFEIVFAEGEKIIIKLIIIGQQQPARWGRNFVTQHTMKMISLRLRMHAYHLKNSN